LALRLAFEHAEHVVFAQNEVFPALDLDFRVGVRAEEDRLTVFYVKRKDLALVVDTALADSDDAA